MNQLFPLVESAANGGLILLGNLLRSALTRSKLVHFSGGLFTPEERLRLANSFANAMAVGDLSARAHLHQLANETHVRRFAEHLAPWGSPVFSWEPMPPERAVRYFLSLIPTLGVDPDEFAAETRGLAFTMAVATEETLLEHVQKAIAETIQGQQHETPAPQRIAQILDEVGVTPANPQYAEMVYRTNVMSAINQGATEELQTPTMQDFFPVWEYLGIADGRQGDDHAPHFGKYYPSSVAFATVRGKRAYNCRCTFRAIDKYAWAALQSQGTKLETTW